MTEYGHVKITGLPTPSGWRYHWAGWTVEPAEDQVPNRFQRWMLKVFF